MKSIKKGMAMVLAATMCISFAACGGGGLLNNKKEGKENTLQISLFYGDYGREWLDDMAAAYESFNPGVTVDVQTVVSYSAIASQIEGGVYVADMVVSITNMTAAGATKGTFLELSDVLNSKATESETKTIKEKLGTAIAASAYNGRYYQLPWAMARTGLFYNKTSLDTIFPNGYELPVTTDGLISFCDDIKASEKGWGFVFTNATEAEYAIYMRDTLSAQYMGYDAFNAYFDGEYYDAEGEKVFAEDYQDLANVWYDAQSSALQVVEKLYYNGNGYAPGSCKTMDYMKAQAYFMGITSQDDYKPTAFMVNGDWLYSGMSNLNTSADIRMMRMPINSAMIKVLPSISTEEQLVECVKYVDSQIDGGAVSKPTYLSDADYEKLSEARRMVWGTHAQHSISIPKNSYQVELAKDFIRFIASDEGGRIYSQNLFGLSSPFTPSIIDENASTNYSRSVSQVAKDAIYITGLSTDMTVLGGHYYFQHLYFVQELNTGKSTAASILEQWTTKTKNNWALFRERAGK